MYNRLKTLSCWSSLFAIVFAVNILSLYATAQDESQQGDDPPDRVARLGYMEGSVSFQPSGEQDWVGAVANRPLTIGDKLWADKGSRAELQLGSAVIRLSENSGINFLNLDDHTIQLQLSSGAINIRVRQLDRDDSFEVDTPNLAFSLYQPGNYRVEASEDGSNTVVTVREGDGEATGNGQSYKIHAGQRTTFSGSNSLEADMEQIEAPDQFDTWADSRDNRWQHSRSSQYVPQDMVGYDDLDDNGDWRDESQYGHVWYPHVEAGWAPYHQGHWDWIDPWGYTWVDDSSWGYAPFHYGRWVNVGGRWGWIAGPHEERAVYAPALVVFVGGGGGWGGNVGWFPLGPREVYVPSYPVSRAYMNRVNVSNTTVNTTTITNVYNTTIVNKTTVTNITYANRNVQGAMTAVPQRAFAGAQPVGRAAVAVNAEQLRAAPVTARVAVNPTREAVLGAKAATANHVAGPPAAVMNRQVIAKKAPPPPPPSFAARQQAMQAHPGQPLPRQELASLRPAAGAATPQPMVKVAPPAKAATPTTGHPPANAGRPGQPAPASPVSQPENRSGNQPAPNQPAPNKPAPNKPDATPNARPGQPANHPPAAQPNNQPENRPSATPPNHPNQPANRPPTTQPNNRPNQPENRPPAIQPNRSNQPEDRRPAAQPKPENRPTDAQQNNRPPANRPQTERPPQRTPSNPQSKNAPQKEPSREPPPEEKKKPEEKKPPQTQ